MISSEMSALLKGQVFHGLIVLAVSIYALNAILIAVEAGYDLWGRFALGCLQGLGGGTIRDFLIGGNRMPLSFTRDPAFIYAILGVTAIVSVLSASKADFHESASFQRVKKYADVCGFALLAVFGACIGVASGLAWFWAPVFAALSSAGGGTLRDIAVMKAPTTFRGAIFEEAAAFGGLLLLAAVHVDLPWFSSPVRLSIAVGFTTVAVIALRLWILAYGIHYPQWLLYKTRHRHEAKAQLDPALGEILTQLRTFLSHCGVSWSVPGKILTDASSSLGECLLLLRTAGRGDPQGISAAFDGYKLLLHLAHRGEPLVVDFNPESIHVETEFNEEQLARGVLLHYTHGLETRPTAAGSEIVMTFQE